jgi:hypothetical protein
MNAYLEYSNVLFEWWHGVRDGTWARATLQRAVPTLRGAVRAELETGTRCACPKTAATCRHQERPVLAYLTPCCQVRYAGTEPPSLLPQTSS